MGFNGYCAEKDLEMLSKTKLEKSWPSTSIEHFQKGMKVLFGLPNERAIIMLPAYDPNFLEVAGEGLWAFLNEGKKLDVLLAHNVAPSNWNSFLYHRNISVYKSNGKLDKFHSSWIDKKGLTTEEARIYFAVGDSNPAIRTQRAYDGDWGNMGTINFGEKTSRHNLIGLDMARDKAFYPISKDSVVYSRVRPRN